MQEPMKHEKNFENLKQQLGLFSEEGNILSWQNDRLGKAPLHFLIAACYPILLPKRTTRDKTNRGSLSQKGESWRSERNSCRSEKWILGSKGQITCEGNASSMCCLQETRRIALQGPPKSWSTQDKGHRYLCVHTRGSWFRRPFIYEDHQRHSKNLHLPVYMCYVQSDTPGTSPRPILGIVH